MEIDFRHCRKGTATVQLEEKRVFSSILNWNIWDDHKKTIAFEQLCVDLDA